MEGLTDTPGDHLGGLIRLERQLNGLRVKPKNKRERVYGLIACVLLLAGILLWIFIQKNNSKDDSVLMAEFQQKSKSVDEIKVQAPILPEIVQNREAVEEELLLEEEANIGSSEDDIIEYDEIIMIEEAVVQQEEEGEISEEDVANYRNALESDVISFNNYLKYVPFALDFIKANPEGEIILTFRINNKGVPSSMRVSEGFSKICNEEIIRLLEQGPKWKQTSRDRVSVKFIIKQIEESTRPEVKMELLSFE